MMTKTFYVHDYRTGVQVVQCFEIDQETTIADALNEFKAWGHKINFIIFDNVAKMNCPVSQFRITTLWNLKYFTISDQLNKANTPMAAYHHSPTCVCPLCTNTASNCIVTNPCDEITLPDSSGTTFGPAEPCDIDFNAITGTIPKKAMEVLFEAYTLDEILRSIIMVLKDSKNPEAYFFEFYLFAKRALLAYTKTKAKKVLNGSITTQSD